MTAEGIQSNRISGFYSYKVIPLSFMPLPRGNCRLNSLI